MPTKPKRPCSYPGCPKLTDGRFCEEHAKTEAKRYEKYPFMEIRSNAHGLSAKAGRLNISASDSFEPLRDVYKRQVILSSSP